MEFDNISKDYDYLYDFENAYLEDICKKIQMTSSFPQSETVKCLDLGGGTGKFSEKLKLRNGWDCFVAGPFANELEVANNKGLKTLKIDLNNIPDLDMKFDVIVIMFCVHYLKDYFKFYTEDLKKLTHEKSKLYIITRSTQVDFPFTKRVTDKFVASQPTTDEILNGCILNRDIEEISFKIEMPRKKWKTMIVNRFMCTIIDEEDSKEAELTLSEEGNLSFYDNLIFIMIN